MNFCGCNGGGRLSPSMFSESIVKVCVLTEGPSSMPSTESSWPSLHSMRSVSFSCGSAEGFCELGPDEAVLGPGGDDAPDM